MSPRTFIVCLTLAGAACVVAVPAQTASSVNVNDCRYASKPPVAAIVRTHDPQGRVTFHGACRVMLRPSFGGAATVVLGGAAWPANQFAGRLLLYRSGADDPEDDLITRNTVTRVPGLRNAFLVQERYIGDGTLSFQLVIVKLGAKMIILSDLGFRDREDELRFLRPAQLYTVARLLR